MNKLQKLAELLLENTETLNLISTIFYDALFLLLFLKITQFSAFWPVWSFERVRKSVHP